VRTIVILFIRYNNRPVVPRLNSYYQPFLQMLNHHKAGSFIGTRDCQIFIIIIGREITLYYYCHKSPMNIKSSFTTANQELLLYRIYLYTRIIIELQSYYCLRDRQGKSSLVFSKKLNKIITGMESECDAD